MNKVYLDILCAFAISIVANIITPYLQKLLHIHAFEAIQKKNKRIAALNRLAQLPTAESPHNIHHPVMAKKYRIQGFVLATGALLWSLLRAGPVAMAISLAAMIITGIRLRRSSRFVNSINSTTGARSLEYQEIN
jgi:hypothetical protein